MKKQIVLSILAASSVLQIAAKEDPKILAATPIGESAKGLTFEKWSASVNVPDPVACSVDPQGRVYVASTARRKAADLDIREHSMWIPDDVGLKSIDEKSAFLKQALAPGNLRAPRGMLKDHNGDGSIDWKDLTAISDRIYQIRDTDGDGVPDKITVFAEGFQTEVTGIAAGVLYHDGWVYATIAPNLWRFKDTDDDGVADIREVVAHGFGLHISYGGHDMHGLSVGPDGRIYWSIGDKGANVTSKEGRHFFYPHEGCVFRVEPDGKGFEVYAHGVRNPQEPTFDDFGDWFAVDNDADFKGEKERLVFVGEGSDSGWRNHYQYMKERTPWLREQMSMPKREGQAAYFLPPIALSTDGPCGFKHDPGTALGEAQRGMFFLTEFPSGVMRGFRIAHDGVGFKQSAPELLHRGVMRTGLAWHPDGSLFSTDWAKGYPLDGRGAVWSTDNPEGRQNVLRKETHELLKTGFEKRPVDELGRLLAHADQRVRLGAQFELAKRGEGKVFLAHALDLKVKQLGRIHAVWGYGQLLRSGAADPAPVLALLKDTDFEIRAQAAKVLGEAKLSPAQAAELIPLLSDPAVPRAAYQAAIALGKLKVPAAAKPLFALAEAGFDSPIMRHAAISGLVGCATPEQLVAKKDEKSRALRLASVVALRRLESPEVALFLKDGDPVVVGEAVRAIHDCDGLESRLPEVAALISGSEREEAVMWRILNAGLRVGASANGRMLLEFAFDESKKTELRAEALAVLLAWKTPPRLDRVDGKARIYKTEAIEALLASKLDALLELKKPELKGAAIDLVMAFGLKPKPEQIAAIVKDSSNSESVRAHAFELLASGERGPLWMEALDSALDAKGPGMLQKAALRVLSKENAARAAVVAGTVLSKGSLDQKQHAVAQLADAGVPEADAVLLKLAGALKEGKASAGLQLDILEAARARGSVNKELGAIVAGYEASEAGKQKAELREGGNPTAGKELVANHLAANCMACHAVAETGSTVGPNLRSIGLEKDKAYLVESLVYPSAKLAPGYGMTIATLRDGAQVAGAPLSEDAETITLLLPDGSKRSLARKDITSQTPPVSVMPPMLGILKPSEIRDAVAYLATLKWSPKAEEKSSEH